MAFTDAEIAMKKWGAQQLKGRFMGVIDEVYLAEGPDWRIVEVDLEEGDSGGCPTCDYGAEPMHFEIGASGWSSVVVDIGWNRPFASVLAELLAIEITDEDRLHG